MAIEDRVLKKLDFHKILIRLAEYCQLPMAREMAESLLPNTDRDIVRNTLIETDEGKEVLRANVLFSVKGAKDVRRYLERCARGGILNPNELLEVLSTLRSGRQVRQFILESKLELPKLKEIVSRIEPQKGLEDEIHRCITEDGTVADDASPELAQLRRAINRLQQRIRDSLDSILRNSGHQKMLQDLLITQRGDRYVVPVKQEYRGAFPGIVHDQSASGATLFIEPMAVVYLGNELREVTIQESREVQRILQKISSEIGVRAEDIAELHESLAKVDFILAKAQLGLDMNAGAPLLVEKQEVRLIQARHPLIKGHVVPLSVELGTKFDTLVITGPNTGGKTVALKTIGLLVAMAQAGLHIPAEGNSTLGIFSQIFTDIGDEQSVEQSLSTFSGHMKNIVHIVDKADGHSLVLLDEVGAGTDPSEGAALAMAILAELHERGCRIVATTHYGALKTFAYETQRVENASVEFDAVTLRPTYRLLVGIPGKSNAFNIAGRLGLHESVLNRARTYITEREMQVSDLLENLEDTHREIEQEKRKAEEERKAVELQSRALDEKTVRLDEKYQEMMFKARDEAAELISAARREAEQLIAELKEALKKEHKQQQDIEKARQGFRKLSNKVEEKRNSERRPGAVPKEQIKLGQTVYMTKFRQKGQILALPNENGEVLVQAGVLKVNVPLTELKIVNENSAPPPRRTGIGKLGKSKSEVVSSEIDLRGMLVEEAAYELDKYLDNAILSGVNQIYVIHGKGTGALRTGVQEFLKGHPHVQNFRLGQHGEGDFGVTVVELK